MRTLKSILGRSARIATLASIGLVGVVAGACGGGAGEVSGSSNAAVEYGTVLMPVDLADVAAQAGVPCQNVWKAVAVALAESNGLVGYVRTNDDGTTSWGLWAVSNEYRQWYTADDLYMPKNNAKAMLDMSKEGTDFSAWPSVANESYLVHRGQAEEAVRRSATCKDSGNDAGVSAPVDPPVETEETPVDPPTTEPGGVEAVVAGTGTDGLRVRKKPTTASVQIGVLDEGARVLIACQISGENVGGSAIWDYIEAEGGYVSDAWIKRADKTIPPTCEQ